MPVSQFYLFNIESLIECNIDEVDLGYIHNIESTILQTSPVDPPQISVIEAESTEQSTEPEWLKSIQTDTSIDDCESHFIRHVHKW